MMLSHQRAKGFFFYKNSLQCAVLNSQRVSSLLIQLSESSPHTNLGSKLVSFDCEVNL